VSDVASTKRDEPTCEGYVQDDLVRKYYRLTFDPTALDEYGEPPVGGPDDDEEDDEWR
jgi:hypothetical protein